MYRRRAQQRGLAFLLTLIVLIVGYFTYDFGQAGDDMAQRYTVDTLPKNATGGFDADTDRSAQSLSTLVPTVAVTSPEGQTEECSAFSSCLDCLYIPGTWQRRHGCVWCASSRKCMTYIAAPTDNRDLSKSGIGARALRALPGCPDVEGQVCPAVLHTTVPNSFRVIHVGIRKGGPEALLQLFLALHYWGFNASFDTRRRRKEKGGDIVPFFKQMYAKELEGTRPLRWSSNYNEWMASGTEGDVLIATETWPCINQPERFIPRGVRQMQWHLTVWPRRDRSACTIVAHTNYIARDYMRQSRRALLFPYVSPHIVKLAKESAPFKEKRALVLLDSDTRLTPSLLPQGRTTREALVATGFTPLQLYKLYGEAKAAVDLRLPGGERLLYEAALFDVCVVIDKTLNGGDLDDFPIPERFRVDSPDDLPALSAAIDDCIANYSTVIGSFAQLKRHALAQRDTFYRHVRHYFSNSVHVFVALPPNAALIERYFVAFILGMLYQVPFAVVEVLIPGPQFDPRVMPKLVSRMTELKEASLLSAVVFTTVNAAFEGVTVSSVVATHRILSFHLRNGDYVGASHPRRALYGLILPLALIPDGHGAFIHYLGNLLALAQRATPPAPSLGDVNDRFLFWRLTDNAKLSDMMKYRKPLGPPLLSPAHFFSLQEALARSYQISPTWDYLMSHPLWKKLIG